MNHIQQKAEQARLKAELVQLQQKLKRKKKSKQPSASSEQSMHLISGNTAAKQAQYPTLMTDECRRTANGNYYCRIDEKKFVIMSDGRMKKFDPGVPDHEWNTFAMRCPIADNIMIGYQNCVRLGLVKRAT